MKLNLLKLWDALPFKLACTFVQWDCCLFWWIHQQWQVALHGYEGTYLIFYSLVSLSEGFTSCAQILPVGTVGKEIDSSGGKACFLLSGPALLVREGISHSSHGGGNRRVSGLLHTFQRLLRHVRRRNWAKKPGRLFLLWVCLSHTGKSHPQVTPGAGKKLITCFKMEHPCFSSRSQYVSKHNAKCLPWSRKS